MHETAVPDQHAGCSGQFWSGVPRARRRRARATSRVRWQQGSDGDGGLLVRQLSAHLGLPLAAEVTLAGWLELLGSVSRWWGLCSGVVVMVRGVAAAVCCVAVAVLGVVVRPVSSSEAEQHDYCIIGGGLAGVQLGYFFEQAGRDYVILERGAAAGSFFRQFPRHRNLISINKRHTGRGGSALALEHNLRHDWHSLLTSVESGGVEEDMLFHKLTDEFYPHADKLADYAEMWAERWALNIRTGAEVTAVRQSQPHGFELSVGGSAASQLSCRWVVVASGLSTPNVPDIPGLEENSVSYNDMPTARGFYANKTVAIIGAGNAGFETFKAVMADAAYVHIHGPSHIRMAWETHYVGDLRSVNVVPCVPAVLCSLSDSRRVRVCSCCNTALSAAHAAEVWSVAIGWTTTS